MPGIFAKRSFHFVKNMIKIKLKIKQEQTYSGVDNVKLASQLVSKYIDELKFAQKK
jgi:hypothetical protein